MCCVQVGVAGTGARVVLAHRPRAVHLSTSSFTGAGDLGSLSLSLSLSLARSLALVGEGGGGGSERGHVPPRVLEKQNLDLKSILPGVSFCLCLTFKVCPYVCEQVWFSEKGGGGGGSCVKGLPVCEQVWFREGKGGGGGVLTFIDFPYVCKQVWFRERGGGGGGGG